MTDAVPAEGHWNRRVWSLTWPVVLANVTTPLVGAVDTAVMGRQPDAAFIGAVAIGATVFNALYWMVGFLRMGTTGLVAQAYGARQVQEMAAVTARAVAVALVLGTLLLALLAGPLASLLLGLFQASDHTGSLAATYLTLRVWGAPALLTHFVVLGTLFGLQRMGDALLVSVLLNVTNVILDLAFVIGLGWGVEGVAAGTVISEWLAAVVGAALVVRALRQRGARRPSRHELLRRDRLTALFGVSANLIVRSLFVQLPFFAFTVLGAGLGDRILAANAVLIQLFFLMSYGLDALAHTAETLTGHAFGARDRATLRRAAGYTLGWSVVVAAAVSVGFALAGGLLIDLMTTLPAVRDTARDYLPWLVAAPLAAVGAFHLDGVFIGTTRTVELRNSMFGALLCYLAALWLTLDRLGNHGVWFAMTVFMVARTVLLGLRYPALERRAAA
ncbi:MAG: MATE family efflux transporter [Gammaproteobacteria bacterium]|nr:MATE family efflux transporter [Gammaproteobacteria bacterium]MBK80941.1 MATE family efflux transporter [Gammaproteobacteria bacterium]